MPHEYGEKFDQEKIGRDLRIDCALTSVARQTEIQNYEIALVSDQRVFTTVVFRDGVGVSANVSFAPVTGNNGVQHIEGYNFKVVESGWEIFETKRVLPEIEVSVICKYDDTTEEHVALLEDVIANSAVVGFETIRPTRGQTLQAIGSKLWCLASNVVTVGEGSLKAWLGVRK